MILFGFGWKCNTFFKTKNWQHLVVIFRVHKSSQRSAPYLKHLCILPLHSTVWPLRSWPPAGNQPWERWMKKRSKMFSDLCTVYQKLAFCKTTRNLLEKMNLKQNDITGSTEICIPALKVTLRFPLSRAAVRCFLTSTSFGRGPLGLVPCLMGFSFRYVWSLHSPNNSSPRSSTHMNTQMSHFILPNTLMGL